MLDGQSELLHSERARGSCEGRHPVVEEAKEHAGGEYAGSSYACQLWEGVEAAPAALCGRVSFAAVVPCLSCLCLRVARTVRSWCEASKSSPRSDRDTGSSQSKYVGFDVL